MPVASEQNTIFALDIGTRTVTGLVGELKQEEIAVIAEEMQEHPGRAMFDGQIHNIPQVASVVSRVKEALEEKTGLSLEKVAVAAAGRALYSTNVSTEMDLNENVEIDRTTIRSLELQGLQEAHKQLEEQREKQHRYYCVGHTVMNYTLDGYTMSSLTGHRGRKAGCELIATFLPVSVVNGLYAVLERSGLEPASLTLEPIAAIEVAIPENFRLLNLALVDMGAGTSDIAISRDGAITGYGMVPLAGDEITEAIVEGCLADFDTAEKVKRQIAGENDITFTDITGLEDTKTHEEMLEIISPAVDRLASEISKNITELNNGRSPRAVFCIGGGAQVPSFTEKLARELGLPPQRVTIRNRSDLKNISFENKEDSIQPGPEGITVAGIAAAATSRIGLDFMSITVNEKEYRLFNTRELSVSDALGLIQFNPRDLIGKNGKDLYFYLNDKKKVTYGGLARPAEISVNGATADLQTPVKDGDDIFIKKAENGEDAEATINDILNDMSLNRHDYLVYVNGQKVGHDYTIQPNDRLELKEKTAAASPENNSGSKQEEHVNESIKVRLNGREIEISKPNPIFVDIFKYIDLDLEKQQGMPVLKLNGERASYTASLTEGDNIEVYWDN